MDCTTILTVEKINVPLSKFSLREDNENCNFAIVTGSSNYNFLRYYICVKI